MTGRSVRRALTLILVYILFVAIVVFFLVPFVWLVLASFNSQATAFITIPQQLTLDNFREIFEKYNFAVPIRNSLIVATATMILSVITVSMASYSLSRWDMRGKTAVMYGILLLQTMPVSATMVPIYGLARLLGLRNSYLGLILVDATIQMPFLIWVMKGFFDTVPRTLEEAAWLDGRSQLRALFEVILPVARSGMAVVAGLSFLASWSEVLMVLILIDKQDLATIPLAFYQTFRTQGGYVEIRYEVVAAMAFLYLIPVMALFLATRRMLVRGVFGGMRGT